MKSSCQEDSKCAKWIVEINFSELLKGALKIIRRKAGEERNREEERLER